MKSSAVRLVSVLYIVTVARSDDYFPQRDFSHMLFTDYTITRFLIVLVLDEDGCSGCRIAYIDLLLTCASVECGNPYHDDYATLAKHHADKMMSLLKYLHSNEGDPKPKWYIFRMMGTYITCLNSCSFSRVRATYTTPSKKLPPNS